MASGGHVIDAAGARRFRGAAEAANANPQCDTAPPDLPPDPSDNARSLALLFSIGKFQFFDAGDLTSERGGRNWSARST